METFPFSFGRKGRVYCTDYSILLSAECCTVCSTTRYCIVFITITEIRRATSRSQCSVACHALITTHQYHAHRGLGQPQARGRVEGFRHFYSKFACACESAYQNLTWCLHSRDSGGQNWRNFPIRCCQQFACKKMPALRNKSWPGPNRGTALKGGAALSSSTLGCIRFTLLSPQSTSVAVRPLGLAPCYLAYYLAGPCSPGSTMLARRCGCGSMFAVSPCSLVAGTYSYRRTPRPRAPRRCVA